MDRLQLKVMCECPSCKTMIIITEQINNENEAKGACLKVEEDN